MSVLVSVVVPVYNVEKYLQTCVNSILEQTVNDFELILIDDGSTDKSGHICDNLAKRDQRIKVLHQNNKGVSAARNLGIRNAKGKWICFIDSDDWVDEDYLETLLESSREKGLSVCGIVMNNRSAAKKLSTKLFSKEEAMENVFFHASGIGGFPVNKLFDNRLLKEYRIFFKEDLSICEDLVFALEYLKWTNGEVIVTNKAPYHYRLLDIGATNSRFNKKSIATEDCFREYEALTSAEQYLLPEENLRKAYKLRKAKAAVASLREIEASGADRNEKYFELLKEVRTNCVKFIFCRQNTLGAKISMIASSVSPRLEYILWKLR